jgi:biopolymer transport protein ExbB
MFLEQLYNLFGTFFSTNWNLVLLLLFIISIIGFAIFVERLLFFRKSDKDAGKLLLLLRKAIETEDFVSALKICEETGGAIAHVIKKGLERSNKSRIEIEQAMELSGLLEISFLEKNTKILSIIAHIAPLIGLLGTVLGFIQAFGEMRQSGLVDISANRIGESLEFALVTTATGLAIAIPAVVGYNYLVGRIETIVLEMKAVSQEVVDILLNARSYEDL